MSAGVVYHPARRRLQGLPDGINLLESAGEPQMKSLLYAQPPPQLAQGL